MKRTQVQKIHQLGVAERYDPLLLNQLFFYQVNFTDDLSDDKEQFLESFTVEVDEEPVKHNSIYKNTFMSVK